MGQGGQSSQGGKPQGESLLDRIKDVVTAHVEPAPAETPAETSAAAPAVTVPDVSGADVGTAPATPAESAPAPAETPAAQETPAAAPISDVTLIRDQLEQVVTNFRARLDGHDSVLADVEGTVKDLAATVETVKTAIEDHKTILDALVDAIELLK